METVLLYALGILGGVFLLYLIGIMVAPYKPNDVKNDHFECGLPPSSEVPLKANFGYFIFAIAFIIFDMSGLFFSLFVFDDTEYSLKIAMIFGILLFAAVTISMKEYRYAKNS
jgi:NADH-quinone oxidoreductase subunit A